MPVHVIIPHKYPLQAPYIPSNLTDKAQDEDNDGNLSRVKRLDRSPSHASPDSNEYNRNVFRSRGHLGFDVPSSGVARWFAPVSAAELKSAVILGRLGNGG